MNEKLKEINELIYQCDEMKKHIGKNNNKNVSSNTEGYIEFLNKLAAFNEKNNLSNSKYEILFEPYIYPRKSCNGILGICDGTLASRVGNFCYEEIEMLEIVLNKIKKYLFYDYSEKIFISHREKDKPYSDALIDLLHNIGLPRPFTDNDEKLIFCSSNPLYYIDIGDKNNERIKAELTSEKHTFAILLYSDNYFKSYPCLNEMGIIWALDKPYQEILIPSFNPKNKNGLLDITPTWFRINDANRLTDFKNNIVRRFGLSSISEKSWENTRNKFLQAIENIPAVK